MSAPLIVMDIGDVLVRTRPMAQYRELARRTGLPWEQVAERIEGSGVVDSFEHGQLTTEGFADAAARVLSCPGLRTEEVGEAWNAVIAEPDPVLAPLAARLAAADRLSLASNTNPLHWRLVRHRLAAIGITAPAWLSFQIGYAKPDPRFFAAVSASTPHADHRTVYVDDRPEHVEAAGRHGWIGWLHRDAAETVQFLHDTLD